MREFSDLLLARLARRRLLLPVLRLGPAVRFFGSIAPVTSPPASARLSPVPVIVVFKSLFLLLLGA